MTTELIKCIPSWAVVSWEGRAGVGDWLPDCDDHCSIKDDPVAGVWPCS